MKKTLAIVASLAIAATVIIVVVVRRNHGPHHHHDSAKTGAVEAVGIDQTDTSVSMMAMKLHDGKSMFKWVAPKDAFVAACQALPVEQQQCMAPRYRRDHGDACQKNRPMPDVLAKMYVGLPIVEPNYQR